MNKNLEKLIDLLESQHSLSVEQYEQLLAERDKEAAVYLAGKADAVRRQIYSNSVYVRGLIEISNICKNNCYYCGIRGGNAHCQRYRLTKEEILSCCEEGYTLGFRTFVMQGGEDGSVTDEWMCDILREIKRRYPDCAVTLSLGERSADSYARLKEAGADRYLLRHETADEEHYARLHPPAMSFANRMQCLKDLRACGYQVGCGFMVGSPYQTPHTLAKDLKFIEDFRPDMCGIGPFIPHKDTPFADRAAGDVGLTLYLLSLIRLIHPAILLPATTALGSLQADGREKGMLAGANVVMPNLSPVAVREKYELYNNKLHSGAEAAQSLKELTERMAAIGFRVVSARGDSRMKDGDSDNRKGGN